MQIDVNEYRELLRLANKQIPKKPHFFYRAAGNHNMICSECRKMLQYPFKYPYCHHCGQKIKYAEVRI